MTKFIVNPSGDSKGVWFGRLKTPLFQFLSVLCLGLGRLKTLDFTSPFVVSRQQTHTLFISKDLQRHPLEVHPECHILGSCSAEGSKNHLHPHSLTACNVLSLGENDDNRTSKCAKPLRVKIPPQKRKEKQPASFLLKAKDVFGFLLTFFFFFCQRPEMLQVFRSLILDVVPE